MWFNNSDHIRSKMHSAEHASFSEKSGDEAAHFVRQHPGLPKRISAHHLAMRRTKLVTSASRKWLVPIQHAASPQHHLIDVLRCRSRVNGNSLLAATLIVAGGTFITPGVWPVAVKRVKRRLSASKELTGKFS